MLPSTKIETNQEEASNPSNMTPFRACSTSLRPRLLGAASDVRFWVAYERRKLSRRTTRIRRVADTSPLANHHEGQLLGDGGGFLSRLLHLVASELCAVSISAAKML